MPAAAACENGESRGPPRGTATGGARASRALDPLPCLLLARARRFALQKGRHGRQRVHAVGEVTRARKRLQYGERQPRQSARLEPFQAWRPAEVSYGRAGRAGEPASGGALEGRLHEAQKGGHVVRANGESEGGRILCTYRNAPRRRSVGQTCGVPAPARAEGLFAAQWWRCGRARADGCAHRQAMPEGSTCRGTGRA